MQKKYSVLLVEDEENLQDALRLNFEMEGYEVTSVYDGAEALKAVHSEYFDVIVLDVMLPEIDGISVCENIRLFNSEIPILILSEKNKLISSKEKVAEVYNFGKNNINFKALECTTKAGEKVSLTKKETMLLKLLIEHKNEVVTREKILQSVWGYN